MHRNVQQRVPHVNVARRRDVAIERHRRKAYATDGDLAVLGGDVARVLGREGVRRCRIRRCPRAGIVLAQALTRRAVRIAAVTGSLQARAQPRDHLQVARSLARVRVGIGVRVLAGQQRRTVLVIEYTRAVCRHQAGNNVRRSLVIRYGRIHAVIVLVLQSERRIDVALARRARVGDVRRGAVMRVRQKSGRHRSRRTIHATRIVVRVRELGTLEHPIVILCRYKIRFRGPIILRWDDRVHRRSVIRERGDVAHVYRRHSLHPGIDTGRVVRIRVLVAGAAAALSSWARRRSVGARNTARVMLRRVREAQRLIRRHRRGWKTRRYATHVA